MDNDQAQWAPQQPLQCGIRGTCPRCGEGKIFSGFLTIKEKCGVCGLDFSFADPADGPAFFVICIICIPIVFIVLWFDQTFNPPYWLHLFTSFPFVLLTCVPPLRPLKAWLVAGQYFHKAEEGKLVSDDED